MDKKKKEKDRKSEREREGGSVSGVAITFSQLGQDFTSRSREIPGPFVVCTLDIIPDDDNHAVRIARRRKMKIYRDERRKKDDEIKIKCMTLGQAGFARRGNKDI